MNKRKLKNRSSNRVLDFIIGVLCVFIVGAGAFAISLFNESFNYHYDEDSFYWRLEDENYSQLVEMYYTNEAAGVKASEELEPYYGVARYFEAASYYKIYEAAEDKNQMAKYQERMEEAKIQMGDLDFLSESICEKLEISE